MASWMLIFVSTLRKAVYNLRKYVLLQLCRVTALSIRSHAETHAPTNTITRVLCGRSPSTRKLADGLYRSTISIATFYPSVKRIAHRDARWHSPSSFSTRVL